MSVTLPLETRAWPRFRIVIRERWGDGGSSQEQSAGGWEALPMARRHRAGNGYYVQAFDRGALPYIGEARFAVRYGLIDGKITQVSSASATRLQANGAQWDADADTLEVRDLTGYFVRIQIAPADTSAWRTVWCGTVQHQEDHGFPGSSIPAGERVYTCFDALALTKTWRMDRHGYVAQHKNDAAAETLYRNVLRPQGYNTSSNGDGRLAKNRSATTWTTDAGVAVFAHVCPGVTASEYWTDRQAAEHALAVSKPQREPLFKFGAATGLLSTGSGNWEVNESDTAWDVLTRICRRERGRGLVFLNWADDSGAPDGPLTLSLDVLPQLYNDITFNSPLTLGPITIAGALSYGNSLTVDLVGDHRLIDASFRLGDPYQYRFDYLETVGERIEVAATLSIADNQSGSVMSKEGVALVRGWSGDEQNTFRDLTGTTLNKRQEARYNPVFQCFKFRPDWMGLLGSAGSGGFLTRGDYRCGDDGAVIVPSSFTLSGFDTPGDAVEVLSDMPLYEDYDNSAASAVRFDAGVEGSEPGRRRMFALLKRTGDKFLTFDQARATHSLSAHVRLDKNSFWIVHSEDEGGTTRKLSDATKTDYQTSGSSFYYYDVAITTGLRLPHRVRLASGDPKGRKRGRIYHPNHHLWLAHHGAIYDLDCSAAGGTAATGFTPKRNARGATNTAPGIVRDDREGLAALHALAWAYYGPTTPRRSASWAMRDCGFLTTYPLADDATGTFPTLGKVVSTISANGEKHNVFCPITRVAYDNLSGVTSWSTEWSELEYE